MTDRFEREAQRRAQAYPTAQRALDYAQDATARLSDLGWRNPRHYPPKPAQFRYIEFVAAPGAPLIHYRGPYKPADDPMADQAIANCFLWHAIDKLPEPRRLLDDPKTSAAVYRHVAMEDE